MHWMYDGLVSEAVRSFCALELPDARDSDDLEY